MSQTKQQVSPQAGKAPEGRVWSTAYMAVAFGLGLTVGLILGQAYGLYWERKNAPAADRSVEATETDPHAGHDPEAHDHAGHDHSGHDHH